MQIARRVRRARGRRASLPVASTAAARAGWCCDQPAVDEVGGAGRERQQLASPRAEEAIEPERQSGQPCLRLAAQMRPLCLWPWAVRSGRGERGLEARSGDAARRRWVRVAVMGRDRRGRGDDGAACVRFAEADASATSDGSARSPRPEPRHGLDGRDRAAAVTSLARRRRHRSSAAARCRSDGGGRLGCQRQCATRRSGCAVRTDRHSPVETDRCAQSRRGSPQALPTAWRDRCAVVVE